MSIRILSSGARLQNRKQGMNATLMTELIRASLELILGRRLDPTISRPM